MTFFLHRHRSHSSPRRVASVLSLLALLLFAVGCGASDSDEAPEEGAASEGTSEAPRPAARAVLESLSAYTEPAYDGQPVNEEAYYRIVDIPIPDSILLEVGGLDALQDGRLAVTTRRGEVWLIDGAYGEGLEPTYTRFAYGLHEPLGLMQARDGSFLVSQRGEVTRLRDTDGDNRADEVRGRPRLAPLGQLPRVHLRPRADAGRTPSVFAQPRLDRVRREPGPVAGLGDDARPR